MAKVLRDTLYTQLPWLQSAKSISIIVLFNKATNVSPSLKCLRCWAHPEERSSGKCVALRMFPQTVNVDNKLLVKWYLNLSHFSFINLLNIKNCCGYIMGFSKIYGGELFRDKRRKHGDLGGGSGCCFKVIFFPEGVNLSYSNAVC